MPKVTSCSPEDCIRIFESNELFALLDVRERKEFASGHILLASSCPLSALECTLSLLVPCRNVPVIVYDSGAAGDGRAKRAVQKMLDMGYAYPRTLEGGLESWEAIGRIVIDGTSPIARGYAEYLEKEKETPHILPEEVKDLQKSGKEVVYIDIRTVEEYAIMHIPGAVVAPGCEAAYRFLDLVPNPEALAVLNCGGRTRGILCTQMLRDFGVPNPVASLRGGTQNWKVNGFDLVYGEKKGTSAPSIKALDFARECAEKMAENQHIQYVDAETFQSWKANANEIPLYIFDVRQPSEYEAGHIPDSRNAQAGQLIQQSDTFAAVRGARIVLVDDTEVRATIAAYWLRQVGMPQVYVLKGGIGGSGLGRQGLEHGAAPVPEIPYGSSPHITVKELAHILEKGERVTVLNVGHSEAHKAGHIPGAIWVSRSRIELARDAIRMGGRVVFTSESDLQASLAADDAKEFYPEEDICWLEGGTSAWKAAGLEIENAMPASIGPVEDVRYLIYQDPHATKESLLPFFDWENKYAAQVMADGSCRYKLPY